MRTWKELGTAFRDLEGGRADARLDYQWGAGGERWQVTGPTSMSHRQQIEALAQIAGSKLLDMVISELEVLNEPDDTKRWYQALVRLSGRFESGQYLTQFDNDGRPTGNTYTGTVNALSDASANLCLHFEAQAALSEARHSGFLQLERYAGPRTHWEEAQRLLDLEEPNLAGVVREAVSAIEGLARLVLAKPSITLGDAIKCLRRDNLLNRSFAKCLETIWTYSNEIPGIRHGADIPVVLLRHEAVFVVGVCKAALQLLRDIDLSGRIENRLSNNDSSGGE